MSMKLSEIAAEMINRGENPDDLCHVLAYPDGEEYGLSSPVKWEDYIRGGYTSVYRYLGDIAAGCWDK